MKNPNPQNILDSPQWVSQSTATAIPEAGGSISPSGTDGPQPQPKDFTLTASPGILCCGVGEKITVTATATGFNAENEPVSVTTPNGTTNGTRSASREYTIKDTDCGTVLSFFGSGPGEEPKKYAKVPVVKLTTETFATVPEDRGRKKLGVCEPDEITVTPPIGTIDWMLVGTGAITPAGFSCVYRAPDRSGTGVVQATMVTTAAETIEPKSISCTVAFQIVEPNAVVMKRKSESGVYHVSGHASAGFCGIAFIFPEDVCFFRINVREGFCLAIASGCCKPAPSHPVGPYNTVRQGTDEHPSVWDTVDTIFFDFPPPFTPSPNESESTILWPIPWVYRCSGGRQEYIFATVDQLAVVSPAGVMDVSKGGFTLPSTNANDPTEKLECP